VSLARRDVDARERMDDPACDPATLARTYERFALVNAIVSGQRSVYRRWIRPRLRTRPLRILDVGTGGADLPRRLLRWTARDRADVRITAIDPDPRAAAFARRALHGTPVEVRSVSTAEIRAAGERFDAVLSNHVLHHLTDAEVTSILDDTSSLVAPGGVAVHADLARSRIAYAAFAAATWPLQSTLLRGTYIRPDGLTSIRRSRTARELAALAPPGWRVRRRLPARIELVWDPRPPGAG